MSPTTKCSDGSKKELRATAPSLEALVHFLAFHYNGDTVAFFNSIPKKGAPIQEGRWETAALKDFLKSRR